VRLRLCEICGIGQQAETNSLAQEANELVAIIGAIVRNMRRNAALAVAHNRSRPGEGNS